MPKWPYKGWNKPSGACSALWSWKERDILNLKCNYYCIFLFSEGNVAHGSLTQNSSVDAGGNSSFAVDNNLTTCFYSQKVWNRNKY